MIAKLLWPIVAACITIALFLLMGYLITPQGEVPDVDVTETSISITRTERDESSEQKGRRMPVKPKPQIKPPPPKVTKTKPVISKNKVSLTGAMPKFNGSGNFKIGAMDRRATPVVRIAPQYPQGPLSRGVEGFVLVEFTITKTGAVEDVVVVDAKPENTFNRAALRAIKRWKYQPQVNNGGAVAQHNMREMFKFKIAKED